MEEQETANQSLKCIMPLSMCKGECASLPVLKNLCLYQCSIVFHITNLSRIVGSNLSYCHLIF